MKKIILFVVSLVISNLSFAGMEYNQNFGFIEDRGLFYNLEGNVFTVYGKGLSDIRLSLGERSTDTFVIRDFKILKDQILFLNKINYQFYCQSYSLSSFEKNFSISCEDGTLNVSKDEKYFSVDWYGEMGSCSLMEDHTAVSIHSSKTGKEISFIEDICGKFLLGENNKSYTMKIDRSMGVKQFNFVEIDLLTNNRKVISSNLKNFRDLKYIGTAYNGKMVGLAGTFTSERSPEVYEQSFVFDLEKGTNTQVYDGFTFLTDHGFFSTKRGPLHFAANARISHIISFNQRLSLGCSDYFCGGPTFYSLNDNVIFGGGRTNDEMFVSKFNEKTTKLETVVLPTSTTQASVLWDLSLTTKNKIFYVWQNQLFAFDTFLMQTKAIASEIPTSSDRQVSSSDDETVVLVWTHLEEKPLFRLYDALTGSLLSESTTIEGRFDCDGLSWIYGRKAKVSSKLRQALIKCGTNRSVAVVKF